MQSPLDVPEEVDVVVVEEVVPDELPELLVVLAEVEDIAAASTAITHESVVEFAPLLLQRKATSTPGNANSIPSLVCFTEAVRLSSKVMTFAAF